MELHLLWVNWDNIQQALEVYFLDIEAIVEIQMDIMQGYDVLVMDVTREVHHPVWVCFSLSFGAQQSTHGSPTLPTTHDDANPFPSSSFVQTN